MKEIKTGDEARASMKKGIDFTVNLAKVTLGGKGRIVTIDNGGDLHQTWDGVTVIRNTAMNDKTEDMGCKMVVEVAEKQEKNCADGTTSASIMLQALVNGGFKNIAAGADPILIKEGIEIGVEAAVKGIEKIAKPIKRTSKEVLQIATVSAHGDKEIGGLIAEAVSKTNEHSSITVKETYLTDSYVELTDGMKVYSGWLDPHFVTHPQTMTAELKDAYVLIYEGKIHELREMVNILANVSQEGKSIVIISDKLEGEPLDALINNKIKNGLKVVAINPFGVDRMDMKERFVDLAAATGGQVISPDLGHRLEDITLDMLGSVKRVVVSEDHTVFENGNSNEDTFNNRVIDLQAQVKNEKDYTKKELLKGRLAAITGGIGVIFVGGAMGTETREKKDRIDDALGAALSAVESGIVPGGGVSLLMVRKFLNKLHNPVKDIDTGIRIVEQALELPFRQIIKNAGGSGDVILNGIDERPSGTGYDVVKGDYVDMLEQGILDPAKVEISLIKVASSVANRFLITEGSITNVPDK